MNSFITDYICSEYKLTCDHVFTTKLPQYNLIQYYRYNPYWHKEREYVLSTMTYREQVIIYNLHQLSSIDFELIPFHPLAYPAPLGHPDFFDLLDKGVRAKKSDAFGIWAAYQQWDKGHPLNRDGTPMMLNRQLTKSSS